MTAIPFAGLAPDARSKRGSGELSRLDLQAAVKLGKEIRTSKNASTKDVATAIVEAVNSFEHDDRPACVLVRAFVTCTIGSRPGLSLLATRGIEPAWNDVAQSVAHREVALDSNPMTVELADQLRLGDSTAPPASTFYIPEAAESSVLQSKSFVASYGVRSVFGFSTTPWPGQSIVVVAFARAFLERSNARLFEILGLYGRVAWIDATESEEGYEPTRARALDDIVAMHETHLGSSVVDYRRRFESVAVESKRAADANASMLEAHNRDLQRTQRAMLNVIEDLREARAVLETKVEQRTRELATANASLESRNRELEEFVYIASHDLQEPLRTVAGYLQMIERRYGSKLGIEGDEFIRFAIEGAQRMQALIESLLLYSRISTTLKTFEPIALDDILDVSLRNLALRVEETKASVERSPLPTIRADRIQMVQLFQNLLSNALKFSGPNPPRIHVTGVLELGTCALTFRDEGIGFNPKFVDRIFKVFRRLRRDTPGTGIGLAVCKKIVERHGGRIEASSSPGTGSTFTVHLPVEPEAAEPTLTKP